MDTTGFSAQFDPTLFGLIKTIEGNLLQGQKEKMSIRPEIYKLNVYGDFSHPTPCNRFFLTSPDSQEKALFLKPIKTLLEAQICLDPS